MSKIIRVTLFVTVVCLIVIAAFVFGSLLVEQNSRQFFP
jgi:hypothetical protein